MKIKIGLVTGEEHVWMLVEADRWEMDDAGLSLYDKDNRVVALYPPGAWLSLRVEYNG